MAIQFVVEDGTGKSTATAYITVAEFKQYWENRGTTFTEAGSEIQAWINCATEYLDSTYKFLGEAYSSTQALQFPRINIIDKRGETIESTSIPQDLKNACAYLAYQRKSGVLDKVGEDIASETYGPVSKTYKGSSLIVKYPLADKLLSGLISSGCRLQRVN